jgi:hypothetical protein
MNRLTMFVATCAAILLTPAGETLAAAPQDLVVLDFDDIQVFPSDFVDINGTNYHEIGWLASKRPGRNGNTGHWLIDDGVDEPEGQGLVNSWGAPDMVIEFPYPTRLIGTLAMGQGSLSNTTAIRVHGFNNSIQVGSTPWFDNLVRRQPQWFEIDLPAVDSISIEVRPSAHAVENGDFYGAFRLDNLTFQYVPEPYSAMLFCVGMASLINYHRRPKCLG